MNWIGMFPGQGSQEIGMGKELLKTHGYLWLENGGAFWESPTLQDPITEDNKKALNDFEAGKRKQRKGV